MRTFRRLIFWDHLIVGATAGLVVLTMSVTGVLLAYERQIMAWADTRGYDTRPPVSATGVGVAVAGERCSRACVRRGRISRRRPSPCGGKRMRRSHRRRTRRDAVVNATPARCSEALTRRACFFRGVTDWHRWLGMGGEQRAIGRRSPGRATRVSVLVVSGFYLWWPRTWTRRQLRGVTGSSRGLPGKARDSTGTTRSASGRDPAVRHRAVRRGDVLPVGQRARLPRRRRKIPPHRAVVQAVRWTGGPGRPPREPAAGCREQWRRTQCVVGAGSAAGRRVAEHQPPPPGLRGRRLPVRGRPPVSPQRGVHDRYWRWRPAAVSDAADVERQDRRGDSAESFWPPRAGGSCARFCDSRTPANSTAYRSDHRRPRLARASFLYTGLALARADSCAGCAPRSRCRLPPPRAAACPRCCRPRSRPSRRRWSRSPTCKTTRAASSTSAQEPPPTRTSGACWPAAALCRTCDDRS